MSNRKAVTVFDDPKTIVESQYGKITYREWCERERDRINKRGDGVQIVERKDGCIALLR
jgi:hypothetical protein